MNIENDPNQQYQSQADTQENTQQNEQVFQQNQQMVTDQGQQDLNQQQQQNELKYTDEQYNNLQTAYTQSRQELQELLKNQGALTQQLLHMQAQMQSNQTQQTTQQSNSLFDLDDKALLERISSNPKDTLKTLIETQAREVANNMTKGQTERLQALETIINTQRVDAALSNLHSKYGHLPVYNEVLQEATNFMTGEGLEYAKRNPSQALEQQFRMGLMQRIESDNNLLTQLTQAKSSHQQQINLSKQMAATGTTSSNVHQQPHSPMQQQPTPQQLAMNQLARKISTYDEPGYGNGIRPMNVVINEI